jgi:hypothetical protein
VDLDDRDYRPGAAAGFVQQPASSLISLKRLLKPNTGRCRDPRGPGIFLFAAAFFCAPRNSTIAPAALAFTLDYFSLQGQPLDKHATRVY